ncbi:MAG: hypothetical protein ACYTGE_10740, partial [Planctomycetota bacterium]
VGARLEMVGRPREARGFAGGCWRSKRLEEGDVGETTPYRMRRALNAGEPGASLVKVRVP